MGYAWPVTDLPTDLLHAAYLPCSILIPIHCAVLMLLVELPEADELPTHKAVIVVAIGNIVVISGS